MHNAAAALARIWTITRLRDAVFSMNFGQVGTTCVEDGKISLWLNFASGSFKVRFAFSVRPVLAWLEKGLRQWFTSFVTGELTSDPFVESYFQ